MLRFVYINSDMILFKFLILSDFRVSKDVNFYPKKKIIFTQVLKFWKKKFKLNPYNIFIKIQTISLTFIKEWLYPRDYRE